MDDRCDAVSRLRLVVTGCDVGLARSYRSLGWAESALEFQKSNFNVYDQRTQP